VRSPLSALRPQRRTRTTTQDEGAAAVEFALIVPVLVIFLFGIIEFGILFAQQLSLSNAARQGARYGVVANYDASNNPTSTCLNIVNEVRNNAATIGMAASGVNVKVASPAANGSCPDTSTLPLSSWTQAQQNIQPCVGTSPGDSITVTATFNGHLVIPLVLANPTFKLTSTGVYRCEYQSQ